MRTKILFMLMLLLLTSTVLGATITPPKSFDFKSYYNLFDANNITMVYGEVNNSPICTVDNGLCVGLSNVTDTNETIRVDNIVGLNCTAGNFVEGRYINGTAICAASAGSGDITAVNTAGPYLSGGATSGDVDLLFSESLMNSTGDSRYVNIDGDIMTGDLTLNGNSLNYVNWTIKESVGHTNLGGVPYLGLYVTRAGSSFNLPHMVLNPGGSGQATVIVRSGAVVNEESACLEGINATNMQCYADHGGFNWSIDFNSSTTGPDWGVADDFEVIGDVKVRDSDGEVHGLNRELELLDEMKVNTLLDRVNSTLISNNLTIIEAEGDNFVVNVDEENTVLSVNIDSILLSEGTNSSPQFNHIYYSNGGTPTLTAATSPQDDKADVAQALIGVDYDYGSIVSSATAYNFQRGTYHRFYDEGTIFKSGFFPTVGTTEINISEGTMRIMLDLKTTTSNHSTLGTSIEIHNDGTFHQHINNLDGYDSYATGEIIGNNRYYNVVCGIAWTQDTVGRMYCVVQNKPPTEHTSPVGAEIDSLYINYFPGSDFITKLYTPVLQVTMRRSSGVNTIQTLSNGELFFDLRGRSLGTGGSPPSPSITSHSDLTNLGFSVAGHIVDQNFDLGVYDLVATAAFADDWSNVTITESQINDLGTTISLDSERIATNISMKNYVDAQDVIFNTSMTSYVNINKLDLSGGTMTGELNISNNNITGIAPSCSFGFNGTCALTVCGNTTLAVCP